MTKVTIGAVGRSSDLKMTMMKTPRGPLTSIRRRRSHQEGSPKVTLELERGLAT
jgi:hypothetical protein